MKYIYKDKNGEQEFTVTEPKDCRMELSKDGYTAIISIHTATNKFREDLDGWGLDHNTLSGALDSACRRILEKSARPSAEKLCSEMEEFYNKLENGKDDNTE